MLSPSPRSKPGWEPNYKNIGATDSFDSHLPWWLQIRVVADYSKTLSSCLHYFSSVLDRRPWGFSVDEQGGRSVSSLVYCLCDATSRACPQRGHVWQECGAQHKRFGVIWLSLWLVWPAPPMAVLSCFTPRTTNPFVTPWALLGLGTERVSQAQPSQVCPRGQTKLQVLKQQGMLIRASQLLRTQTFWVAVKRNGIWKLCHT